MKIKYRRDAKPGVVFRVAVSDERSAYFCSVDGNQCWMYNFLTDYPTRQEKYFPSSRWLRPYYFWHFTLAQVDVCKLVLSSEEAIVPGYWTKAPDHPSWPLPYQVWEAHTGMYNGTEADIEGIFPLHILRHDNIVPTILEVAPQLELIRVPPEERDTRANPEATDAPQDWAEDEERIVEVIFTGGSPELLAQRETIEEQLGLELDLVEAGTVNGSGVLADREGNCVSFDITLNIEPRRLKTALRAIRSVLKRFKAPPDTEILEHHPEYEEPIAHPLVMPPKKSRND
jgi:hypothetical protein